MSRTIAVAIVPQSDRAARALVQRVQRLTARQSRRPARVLAITDADVAWMLANVAHALPAPAVTPYPTLVRRPDAVTRRVYAPAAAPDGAYSGDLRSRFPLADRLPAPTLGRRFPDRAHIAHKPFRYTGQRGYTIAERQQFVAADLKYHALHPVTLW